MSTLEQYNLFMAYSQACMWLQQQSRSITATNLAAQMNGQTSNAEYVIDELVEVGILKETPLGLVFHEPGWLDKLRVLLYCALTEVHGE